MVYHEIRNINGKKQNYLIHNYRSNGKWIKKSKFIGYGEIKKEKINELKNKFKIEFLSNIKSKNLTKNQLILIENLKEKYSKKMSELSIEEYEKFKESFFTELTYNSNAIEGSTLSLEETKLIINEGIAPEGKTLREINETKNHIKAINFLNNYKKDLDELLILKLHSIILSDISIRFAGKYRESQVKIFGSDVKFPDSTHVPQLVKNLVYWYKEEKKRMHPFELAILFSAKLVSIHPFVDGNGRISRLLMNFILKKNNYPWINIYKKQREKYLKAIRKANNEDYNELINFSIDSLKENLISFGIIDS